MINISELRDKYGYKWCEYHLLLVLDYIERTLYIGDPDFCPIFEGSIIQEDVSLSVYVIIRSFIIKILAPLVS